MWSSFIVRKLSTADASKSPGVTNIHTPFKFMKNDLPLLMELLQEFSTHCCLAGPQINKVRCGYGKRDTSFVLWVAVFCVKLQTVVFGEILHCSSAAAFSLLDCQWNSLTVTQMVSPLVQILFSYCFVNLYSTHNSNYYMLTERWFINCI